MYRNAVNQKVCEQARIAKRKLNEMDNPIEEVKDFAGSKFNFLYFYCVTKANERVIVAINKNNIENEKSYRFARITNIKTWKPLTNNNSQNLTSQY